MPKESPGPILDEIVFEVRYAHGHVYLDRCGQTLVDIEREMPDWIPAEATPQQGLLQNPRTKSTANFNAIKFDVTTLRPSDTAAFATDADKLWKLIERNLGLSEFIRVGCKTSYFLPLPNLDAAEEKLQKCHLQVKIPEGLAFFTPSRPEVAITLTPKAPDAAPEYRLVLRAVNRTEGVEPPSILRVDPRLLSPDQRRTRLRYLADPPRPDKQFDCGLLLAVDTVRYGPDRIQPRDFVMNAAAESEKTFLPLLKNL